MRVHVIHIVEISRKWSEIVDRCLWAYFSPLAPPVGKRTEPRCLAIVSGKDRNVEILFVASEKEFKSFLPSTPNLKETLRTGKTRLETLREREGDFWPHRNLR